MFFLSQRKTYPYLRRVQSLVPDFQSHISQKLHAVTSICERGRWRSEQVQISMASTVQNVDMSKKSEDGCCLHNSRKIKQMSCHFHPFVLTHHRLLLLQVGDFSYITEETYTKEEIIEYERVVLLTLDFELNVPTVRLFLNRFLKAALADVPADKRDGRWASCYTLLYVFWQGIMTRRHASVSQTTWWPFCSHPQQQPCSHAEVIVLKSGSTEACTQKQSQSKTTDHVLVRQTKIKFWGLSSNLEMKAKAGSREVWLTFRLCVVLSTEEFGKFGCRLEALSGYIAELSLLEYASLRVKPSMIAAAAVLLAQWCLFSATWSPTLHHYTTYTALQLRLITQLLVQAFLIL